MKVKSNTFCTLCVASLIALFAGLPVTVLGADKLPTGDKVLEDYIEATGGRAAYEKMHNCTIEGKMEMSPMGVKGTIKLWAAEPNKSYMEMTIEGMGTGREGMNGDVVWTMSDMQGSSVADGEVRDSKLRDATFNSELKWKDIYKSVECVGIEKVDDRDCYKVVKTPPTGKPQTSYYDVETKLLVKKDSVVSTEMGEIPIESFSSDYRKVDGVMIPHKEVVKVGAVEQTLVFDKIETNVKMAEKRFAVPQEIKDLIAKKKAKAAQAEKSEKEAGK